MVFQKYLGTHFSNILLKDTSLYYYYRQITVNLFSWFPCQPVQMGTFCWGTPSIYFKSNNLLKLNYSIYRKVHISQGFSLMNFYKGINHVTSTDGETNICSYHRSFKHVQLLSQPPQKVITVLALKYQRLILPIFEGYVVSRIT